MNVFKLVNTGNNKLYEIQKIYTVQFCFSVVVTIEYHDNQYSVCSTNFPTSRIPILLLFIRKDNKQRKKRK